MMLPHGGLKLGSTTTICVVPFRPDREAVVIDCTSLRWPAGEVGEVMNDIPLLFKWCMTIVVLSLLLRAIVMVISLLRGNVERNSGPKGNFWF